MWQFLINLCITLYKFVLVEFALFADHPSSSSSLWWLLWWLLSSLWSKSQLLKYTPFQLEYPCVWKSRDWLGFEQNRDWFGFERKRHWFDLEHRYKAINIYEVGNNIVIMLMNWLKQHNSIGIRTKFPLTRPFLRDTINAFQQIKIEVYGLI